MTTSNLAHPVPGNQPAAAGASFPPSVTIRQASTERDGQSAELVPIGAAVAIASSVTPELIARAQTGDHAAFEQLFTHYETQIFNFVYRLMGDRDDAAELTQDTFLKAYLALPKTAPDLKLQGWLFRIATNVCLDELRHRKLVKWERLADFFGTFLSPSSGTASHTNPREARRHGHKLIDRDIDANPEAAALAREHAEAVQRTLDRMRPTYRACLVLREFHDLDYDGIAAALSTSRNAVKSLLYRARYEFEHHWRAVSGDTRAQRVRRPY